MSNFEQAAAVIDASVSDLVDIARAVMQSLDTDTQAAYLLMWSSTYDGAPALAVQFMACVVYFYAGGAALFTFTPEPLNPCMPPRIAPVPTATYTDMATLAAALPLVAA